VVFLKRRLPLRRRVPPRMLASSSSTSVPSSPERRVNSHSSATGWTCTNSTALASILNLAYLEAPNVGIAGKTFIWVLIYQINSKTAYIIVTETQLGGFTVRRFHSQDFTIENADAMQQLSRI
jgi:hypothetical protein